MPDTLAVSEVVCHAALPADRFAGLLCYASCRLGHIRLDSLQVRRGLDGTHYLKWASRKDAGGYEHPYIEFVDPSVQAMVKAAVERAVLAAAKSGGWIS